MNKLLFSLLFFLLLLPWVSAHETNTTRITNYNYYYNETNYFSNLSYVETLEKELIRTRSSRDIFKRLMDYYRVRNNVNITVGGTWIFKNESLFKEFLESNICNNCTIYPPINITVQNESYTYTTNPPDLEPVLAAISNRPDEARLSYMFASLELIEARQTKKTLELQSQVKNLEFGVILLIGLVFSFIYFFHKNIKDMEVVALVKDEPKTASELKKAREQFVSIDEEDKILKEKVNSLREKK